jgi:transposase
MTTPYSEDLRERIVRGVEAGASRRATAQKYEVSISFVIKLMQRWRRTGSVDPGRIGGQKTHLLAAYEGLVRRLVAVRQDITLDELRAGLAKEGVTVGRSSVARFLKAIGLTRKKRRSTRPSRTAPTLRRRAPPGARHSRS